MKADNKKMAAELTSSLLPKFKGLNEKSATKMIKAVEAAAADLAKKFHKLHDDDKDAANKLLKKAAKKQDKVADKAADKQEKAAEKAAKQAQIAIITASAPKAAPAPKPVAPVTAKAPAKKAPQRRKPAPKLVATEE